MEPWVFYQRSVDNSWKETLADGDLTLTPAITQYEEKILKYIEQLDSCIEVDATAHKVSDVTNLFYWFAFDAMGDFVFNKSFGMLQDREWHHIVLLLQRALSLLGPFSPVPWLLQLGLKCMPRIWILKDWFDMVAWCELQMHERVKVGLLVRNNPDYSS